MMMASTSIGEEVAVSDVRALLLEPTPRAARAVALGLLDVLDTEHARLTNATDTEALHDFRVALRRLRSWLRAYRRDVRDSVGKKSVKKLGILARITTSSRDIEVHIAWLKAELPELTAADRSGARWLLRKLTAEKNRADAASQLTLGEEFTHLSARLRKNLSRYAVAVWDQESTDRWAITAATQVQEAFVAFRHRLAAVTAADDDEHMHRARIAGKRLRYLLEPLVGVVDGATESVESLKGVQDLLGDIHDAFVFNRALRRMARAHRGRPRAKGRTIDPKPGLRALARRLDTRRAVAWGTFTEAWLEGDFPALSTRLHGIVQSLRTTGGAGVEIERKYLLRKLPVEVRQAPVAEIEQGYLPGEKLVERLRRIRTASGVQYVRTVKSGAGLVRSELEEPCTYDVFKAMWPLTKGRRLKKRRYRVADAGHVWEVDEFRDRKLVLAEIELTSANDVVELPDWLERVTVREVTGEPEYVNANLAR